MKLSENFSLHEFTRSQTAIRNNIDNTPTDKQIFNVITDNYKLSHIVDMIKNNKDVQLNMINTPLLNQYSYEVNIDKILKLGYYPNSNIHEEITNTIKLFDGVAGV